MRALRRFAIVLALVLSAVMLCPSLAGATDISLDDGTYLVEVSMTGGTGRAHITSPTALTVADGEATARVEWSSPNYDYMLVDGERYLPVNTEGNSVFEIPVTVFNEPMPVIGDTTAMSTPHEVAYELTFDAASVQRVGDANGAGGSLPWLLAGVASVGAVAFVVVCRRKRAWSES